MSCSRVVVQSCLFLIDPYPIDYHRNRKLFSFDLPNPVTAELLVHPASRQLSSDKDSEIIAKYQDPSFVLSGWNPELATVILKQPEDIILAKGGQAAFSVKVAAITEASYQWYKNEAPVEGATNATYTIKKVTSGDAASYSILIKNKSGIVTSRKATLTVR